MGAALSSRCCPCCHDDMVFAFTTEDQRRMRYLAGKFNQAYASLTSPDGDVPASSRLRMSPGGSHPQNPFVDVHAFEASLNAQTYLRASSQGRFTASHANPCIGKVIEYQHQRQQRGYMIGLQQHAQPNDYVNLFLEELKQWTFDHLTQHEIDPEELHKRVTFLSKLKQDRYHWVFPNESDLHEFKLHDVIDFVHERILDVLRIVRTEQKNQSMFELMKRMNGHTLNAFNYGRAFLTFLLFTDTPAGADLLASSRQLDQSSIARGKLAALLSATSASVLRIADDTAVDERPDSEVSQYEVQLPRVMPASFLRSAGLVVSVTGPRGGGYETWEVVRSEAEFDEMAASLRQALGSKAPSTKIPKRSGTSRSRDPWEDKRGALGNFLRCTLQLQSQLPSDCQARLAAFLEVGTNAADLARTKPSGLVSEEVPNVFAVLKRKLDLAAPRSSDEQTNSSRGRMSFLYQSEPSALPDDLDELKSAWGWESASQILQAFSLLQRLCTMLSWTYEINMIFVAMFGNTLSFSQIPLKDMLDTQRVVVMQLMALFKQLFDAACDLNRMRDYAWHHNMSQTDTNMRFFVHHANHVADCISQIEREHLDYSAQAKRLQEVMKRFGPLIKRIDSHLPGIQRELGLMRRGGQARDRPAGDGSKWSSSGVVGGGGEGDRLARDLADCAACAEEKSAPEPANGERPH